MGFDLLSEYTIPYQHPLAVHFPLVLLVLATAAAVAYAALGRPVWRQAALALFVLGAASAYWSVQTGETLEHEVEGEPLVEAVVEAHETAGEWTLRLSLLAAIAFAGVTLWLRRRPTAPGTSLDATRDGPEPLAQRLLLLVPALAAALLVLWTGHLGGIMVWGVPTAAVP